MKLYNQIKLSEAEQDKFVFSHLMAMTGEKLHSKHDIAYELGARDKRIVELEELLKEAGEICDAVAHVGVDFGYGVYVLEDSVIHRARLILESLKEPKT